MKRVCRHCKCRAIYVKLQMDGWNTHRWLHEDNMLQTCHTTNWLGVHTLADPEPKHADELIQEMIYDNAPKAPVHQL